MSLILFSSLKFIYFFVAVFSVYWLLPQRYKNIFLLISSYIFYASWNWKLLSILLISTYVNYYCGIKINKSKNQNGKKLYLYIGVVYNILALGFFKYFGFFVENFIELLNSLGLNFSFKSLNIILPIGISFYTFQVLSYIIDVYKGKIEPTKNIVNFSLFIAYFPKLLAGPIERAKNLIPQFQSEKKLKEINFKEGVYLFIYGLFKKAVIADTISPISMGIFSLSDPTGAQILMGIYLATLWVYCDFSGYTDMARGVSNFFGIKLSINFNMPFFATNPLDYLRRWHMTLVSWIRDYIYTPLFFYLPSKIPDKLIKSSTVKFYTSGTLAGFISLIIFGLWHGPEWYNITSRIFLFFAILISLVYSRAAGKFIIPVNNYFIMGLYGISARLLTYHTIVFTSLIRRTQNIPRTMEFVRSVIFKFNFNEFINLIGFHIYLLIIFLFIYELIQYVKDDQLFILNKNFYYQIAFYAILFFLFIEAGGVLNRGFVYFQY